MISHLGFEFRKGCICTLNLLIYFSLHVVSVFWRLRVDSWRYGCGILKSYQLFLPVVPAVNTCILWPDGCWYLTWNLALVVLHVLTSLWSLQWQWTLFIRNGKITWSCNRIWKRSLLLSGFLSRFLHTFLHLLPLYRFCLLFIFSLALSWVL